MSPLSLYKFDVFGDVTVLSLSTHFITDAGSGIATVQDLKGKRVSLGSRGSMQAGLLPYYFLQQSGARSGP
jgi:ABC-type phosphate/phosphonate transport system substrate-binding protein